MNGVKIACNTGTLWPKQGERAFRSKHETAWSARWVLPCLGYFTWSTRQVIPLQLSQNPLVDGSSSYLLSNLDRLFPEHAPRPHWSLAPFRCSPPPSPLYSIAYSTKSLWEGCLVSCFTRMPQLPQLAHKVPIMKARVKMKLHVTNMQPVPEKFLRFHWAY